MTCFHPVEGYRSKFVNPATGKRPIVYSPKDAICTSPLFRVKHPCGQCSGCRLEYSRQWGIRCMHEASLHDDNCFITLTYDSENLPYLGSLNYDHWTRFMKRFRKMVAKPYYLNLRQKFGRMFPSRIYWKLAYKRCSIRFYMGPEYGEQSLRPHFHALIFGYDFPDKYSWKQLGDFMLYRSPILERLWPYGYSSVGSVTFQSAAYVARYMMKKVKGGDPDDRYLRVDPSTGEIFKVAPERARMSLKPGIGKEWFDKFKDDVYPSDEVILNGRKVRPPKYYDALLEKVDPSLFEVIKDDRRISALDYSDNNTYDRLLVREKCHLSRLSHLVRNLDGDLL